MNYLSIEKRFYIDKIYNCFLCKFTIINIKNQKNKTNSLTDNLSCCVKISLIIKV